MVEKSILDSKVFWAVLIVLLAGFVAVTIVGYRHPGKDGSGGDSTGAERTVLGHDDVVSFGQGAAVDKSTQQGLKHPIDAGSGPADVSNDKGCFPDANQKLLKMSGLVVDSKTDFPVANAWVRIGHTNASDFPKHDSVYECFTGEDGSFAIEVFYDVSYYWIKISSDGYMSHKSYINLNSDALLQDVGILKIKPDPLSSSISGIVTTLGGVPIDDIDVLLIRRLDSGQYMIVSGAESWNTRTKEGLFRFDGIPEAKYMMYAGSSVYSTVKIPEFELAVDENKTMNFMLEARKNRIYGKVVDSYGRAVPGAALVVMDDFDIDECPEELNINFGFVPESDRLFMADSAGVFNILTNKKSVDALILKKGYACSEQYLMGNKENVVKLKNTAIVKGRLMQKGTDEPMKGYYIVLRAYEALVQNGVCGYYEPEEWYPEYFYYNLGTTDIKAQLGFDPSVQTNYARTDDEGRFEMGYIRDLNPEYVCVASSETRLTALSEKFRLKEGETKDLTMYFDKTVKIKFNVTDIATKEPLYTMVKVFYPKSDGSEDYFLYRNSVAGDIYIGTYKIRMRREGYKTFETMITVTGELEVQEFDFSMEMGDEPEEEEKALEFQGTIIENGALFRSQAFVCSIRSVPSDSSPGIPVVYECKKVTDQYGRYCIKLNASGRKSVMDSLDATSAMQVIIYCSTSGSEGTATASLSRNDLEENAVLDVDVTLMPNRVVEGLVLGEDGAPIVGAHLEFVESYQFRETTTDQGGYFEMKGGTLMCEYIVVSFDDSIAVVSAPKEDDVSEMRIMMRKEDLVKIEGEVVDLDGSPVFDDDLFWMYLEIKDNGVDSYIASQILDYADRSDKSLFSAVFYNMTGKDLTYVCRMRLGRSGHEKYAYQAVSSHAPNLVVVPVKSK